MAALWAVIVCLAGLGYAGQDVEKGGIPDLPQSLAAPALGSPEILPEAAGPRAAWPRLPAGLSALLPGAPRPAQAAPLQRAQELLRKGEFRLAGAELERAAQGDHPIETEEALQQAAALLRRLKAYSYDRGEDELQEVFQGEASAAQRAGRLSGFASAPTAVQEGGTCLFCATGNALEALGQPSRLRPMDIKVREALSEPGVGDANVQDLARLWGAEARSEAVERLRSPEELVRRLSSRGAVLASLSLHEDNPAGRKEWRHIVFIRQAFYSRRARGWVFGVQDSLKGRIEYYTWKRLRNLADSVHYLEVPGLRPQATGDADDLLARAAQRKLPGNIFIQQEQEGNLFNPDLRDSSGDVFRYYRPTELSAALAAKIDLGLRWFEKPGYWLRRALGGRGTYAAWNAWPLRAKLAYLDALEKDVARERGDAAVWDGKVFLLLERGPSAPAYVARHPHMEPAPASREEGPYARFSQPEIVSAKDSPAHSVLEALGRTRRVIAETGHAGTQYHVFMKVEPQTVEEQWPRLQQALQLVNDSLFAHVLEGGDWRDLVHESLGPWHAGRSRRAARLIEERGGAAASLAEDPDSEKHAFVGLRYWGLEDGKLLLSLELRGASLPWKSRPPVAVRMDAPVEKQERDYSQASRYLALLSLLAQGLVEGRLPELGYSLAPESGLAQADAALTAAARRKQMSRSSYYDMRALWRAFGGSGAVAPGLLHPFAVNPFDPAVQSLADALLERSLELRHSTIERNGLDEQARRFFQHRLLRAYRDWALAFARRANGRVDALLRSIAL